MTLTKTGYFGFAGGGKDGAIVDAWLATRFPSPPEMNSQPPAGAPDAGPVTTGINYGGPGAYILTMTLVADYYIRVQYGGNAYWSECAAATISGNTEPSGTFTGTVLDLNGQVFNVKNPAYNGGAIGNGTADDTVAIQAAINAAFTAGGGTVYLPPGIYYIAGGADNIPLIPCKGSVAGGWASAAGLTITLKGAGQRSTSLLAGNPFLYNGILGSTYAGYPVVGQVICEDLTFDGNYSGVGGGAIAACVGTAGGLVSLPWPDTSASAPAYNGKYHQFNRVRFYRPPGFTFQPSQGIKLTDCVFDSTGQPDIVYTGNHWDNLGSGAADAIAIGCTWVNASGNYADFTAGGVATTCQLTMIGCRSFNHQIGGVIALGVGSVIVGNQLHNAHSGFIGYDSTNTLSKANNIVADNVLTNMTINLLVPSTTYGDKVRNNISDPVAANPTWALPVSNAPWINQTGTDGTLYVRVPGVVTGTSLNGASLSTDPVVVGQSFRVASHAIITFSYTSPPTLVYAPD
jgi:hypothetical protein